MELAGELAPLIEHFRQAGTPEERARIKEDGRRHLEELFDEQTERHRQRIAEAEQHLEHLRELLELRINRRQRIIDRQADSLFDPNG